MERVKTLDYLRGLMAISILIYHYYSWFFHYLDATSVLGRVGIYGVGIFYVLSGLTLYLVYRNTLRPNFESLSTFAIKRIARIFPLLWLATTLTIMIRGLPLLDIALLNYSGLFGFIEHYSYIATGAWSIGNELFFYAAFPLLLFAAQKSGKLLLGAWVLCLLSGVYFAFFLLSNENSLADQEWKLYIHPLNQLPLFASGVGIGYLLEGRKVNQAFAIAILIASLCLFAFYPVEGGQIQIVTGVNRIIFIGLSCLICMSIYMLRPGEKKGISSLIDKLLLFLGEISYGIYLLHPIAYYIVKDFSMPGMPPASEWWWPVRIAACIGLTFVMSILSYYFLEKPLIKLGKSMVGLIKQPVKN